MYPVICATEIPLMRVNLDKRYHKWVTAHYPMWKEGCCCEICQAITAEDEKKLRELFLSALRAPLPDDQQLGLFGGARTNYGMF